MSNGLTSSGFQIDSLSQNIISYEQDLKSAYKNPRFSIEDNENIGQLLKVIANRETKVWQAIQQVYNIWTRNGAEGIFLDEMFALNGIFRRGATSGSGDAVIQTDNTALDTTTIAAGTLFSAENGLQYATQTSQIVSNRVTAYRVVGGSVSLATYNLSVTNTITGVDYTQSFTLNSASTAARLTFINSLKTFLQSVNPAETNIYVDESTLTLYWGFDEAYELRGLSQTVNLRCTPTLGNRYTFVECVATTTGFNPLNVGEIINLTPVPTGYLSVTNVSKFSSGSDIETDAAFIERARQETDSPRSSTRAAIVAGLLSNVSGIERVTFNKSISAGIVTVTPIIVGGELEDIAKELYRTQPINNRYSGTTTYQIQTEDGEVEDIQFTRGVEQQLSVRVTYSTALNTPLNDSEENTAKSNLADLSESWQLGDKIFNFSLMSAVSGAVSYGRFKSLLVEVKKLEQPDSAYSGADYQSLDSELPTLQQDNITFVQVL